MFVEPDRPTRECIISAAAAQIFAEQIDAGNGFVDALATTGCAATS
jgi:hypothetical protein